MSSGIDFGAMGVCVMCFDNDTSTPDGALYIDTAGDTWDICVDCWARDVAVEGLLWAGLSRDEVREEMVHWNRRSRCCAVTPQAQICETGQFPPLAQTIEQINAAGPASACWLPIGHHQPHRAVVPKPAVQGAEDNRPARITRTWTEE